MGKIQAKKKYTFEPDYAVAPGNTLQEVMVSLDMGQKELAKRLELTEQTLNRIFKGDQPISYSTASRLELVTRVPAHFWNNLEAEYREQLAKIEEQCESFHELKNKLRLWDFREVLEVHDALSVANERINKLQLVPQGF